MKANIFKIAICLFVNLSYGVQIPYGNTGKNVELLETNVSDQSNASVSKKYKINWASVLSVHLNLINQPAISKYSKRYCDNSLAQYQRIIDKGTDQSIVENDLKMGEPLKVQFKISEFNLNDAYFIQNLKKHSIELKDILLSDTNFDFSNFEIEYKANSIGDFLRSNSLKEIIESQLSIRSDLLESSGMVVIESRLKDLNCAIVHDQIENIALDLQVSQRDLETVSKVIDENDVFQIIQSSTDFYRTQLEVNSSDSEKKFLTSFSFSLAAKEQDLLEKLGVKGTMQLFSYLTNENQNQFKTLSSFQRNLISQMLGKKEIKKMSFKKHTNVLITKEQL